MKNGLSWHRRILPNGLRVLYLPKHSANTAQLSIAIEYGSNHEQQETAGTAHFLEHMLAGGSDKRINLSRSVENYGGLLNFYTNHEYTMNTLDILPEYLPEGVYVVSELLSDTVFEQDKFEKEQKIILNELAEASDDPATRLEELMLKNLFKKHPIRRPIGGYPKTIKKLTVEHLKQALKAYYQPQNMILVLTGNLTEENIQDTLHYFNDKRAQNIKEKQTYTFENSKSPAEIIEKKKGIAQTYLSISTKTVSSCDENVPALDLISMIISGGTSSRLFIELREKQALTYDAVSIHSKGKNFGYFTVNCAVKSSNMNKAKAVIFKELTRLGREKISEEELERNKKMIVSGILRGIDTTEECQDILTFMEIQFNNEKALVNYLEKVKAVKTDDILSAADRYLQKDNLSIAILSPK